MRSVGNAIRTIAWLIWLAYWAYRIAHRALRLLDRAGDPSAGPPEALADVLADVGMDGMAEVLADVPPVEPDPAAEAVHRASSRWRHTG